MIYIIDDDIAVRTSLMLLLEQEGYATTGIDSPEEAMGAMRNGALEGRVMPKAGVTREPSLVILDLNFSIDTSGTEGLHLLERIRVQYPLLPVILITGWASIELAVKGMKLGANDFINKPWGNEHLLQSVRTLLDLRQKPKERVTRRKLDSEYQFQHIIGEDAKMLEILGTVGRVAGTDASVLITGESGTGKELIAEAIHQNSLRHNKAFCKVNLGGISASLFESEMFGHVRGAFTDARYDRVGRFELANKGTVFLDEIGDLDMSSQVKLLRVLQDRTYEVLGSSRTKTVDMRVICATNKVLVEMVHTGSFREDLLYRINLITIHLPALRERPGDIPLLVHHFIHNLREIYNRPGLGVSPEAMKWVQQLPLPGNIRQLKNLVERAVLVSRHELLGVDDFRAQLDADHRRPGGGVRAEAGAGNRTIAGKLPDVGSLTLEEMEIQMIRKALEFHKGRITKVARSLGITRSALYRRLEKYNIPYDEASD